MTTKIFAEGQNFERQDEGEATPEERQERADEARETTPEQSLVDNLMNLLIENKRLCIEPIYRPEWLINSLSPDITCKK